MIENRNMIVFFGSIAFTLIATVPYLTAMGLLATFFGVPGTLVAVVILLLLPVLLILTPVTVGWILDTFVENEEKDAPSPQK